MFFPLTSLMLVYFYSTGLMWLKYFSILLQYKKGVIVSYGQQICYYSSRATMSVKMSAISIRDDGHFILRIHVKPNAKQSQVVGKWCFVGRFLWI